MNTRKLFVLSVAVALAACGSSSSSTSSGGGGDANPTGTLAGAAFSPTSSLAAVYPQASCPIPGTTPPVSVSATALVLGFTSLSNSCSVYQAIGVCDQKANMVGVMAQVARANIYGASVALTPGTYALNPNPSPDAQGNLAIADFAYVKTNATCVDAAGSVTATAGSVTIASITATRATGSMSVTFSDSSTFSGSFDVAICPVTGSICSMIASTCSGTPTCVP
jgi:hypothetical protein